MSAIDTPQTGALAACERLILVRHGRSAHVHRGWIDAVGFVAWRGAYEAAGLRPDELPPAQLSSLTSAGAAVLSSDAPRAIASAHLLALGREIRSSPLLRELDLEGPALGRLRLPLAAWALLVGLRIARETIRGRYPSPAEASRIAEAARWIDDIARQHPVTIAITHASFRKRLAQALCGDGWRRDGGDRSTRPWSAWALTRARSPDSPPSALTVASCSASHSPAD